MSERVPSDPPHQAPQALERATNPYPDVDYPVRTTNTRPSPQWWGALPTTLLALSALWFLTYCLLDIPAQQRLGPWNYAIATLLSMLATQAMRFWRGDPTTGWRPGPSYAAQGKQDRELIVGALRHLRAR